MESATCQANVLPSLRRAVVIAAAFFLPACGGGLDESELEDVEEIGQAQAKEPTTGDACTIERCSGIKDPFGKLTCKDGVCTCARDGASGTCDSEGKNCKEKCSGTTTTPSSNRPGTNLDFDVVLDEVYVDDEQPTNAPIYEGAIDKLSD